MTTPILTDPSGLPLNHPMVNADVGRSWKEVAMGERIKTSYQYFAYHVTPCRWILSSYMTREGFVNPGKMNYRAPVSLRAWLSILPSLTAKYIKEWRYWVIEGWIKMADVHG